MTKKIAAWRAGRFLATCPLWCTTASGDAPQSVCEMSPRPCAASRFADVRAGLGNGVGVRALRGKANLAQTREIASLDGKDVRGARATWHGHWGGHTACGCQAARAPRAPLSRKSHRSLTTGQRAEDGVWTPNVGRDRPHLHVAAIGW